jgi:chorismate mutase
VTDDALTRFRDEITAIDREIVALVNRRIETVARLKRHKDEHGIDFVDHAREMQMVAERVRENDGPLSEAGLRELQATLLALTKAELRV